MPSSIKDEVLNDIEMMVNNYRNNFKDYNLTLSEANKRYKTYEQLNNEKNSLKRAYDALFEQKSTQREILANNSDGPASVEIRLSSLTKNTMQRPCQQKIFKN